MNTIICTAINGRPVVDIVTQKGGLMDGKQYAITYGSTCKHECLIEHYGLKQEVFPLHRIIGDYFTHYGSEKAVEILISKGIININNRPIIWI